MRMIKNILKNKKAMDFLNNVFIFLFLNLIFFVIMFGFVAKAGTGATIVEQNYAKQIALIIDQAKPGSEISINLDEVYELADENKFSRQNVIRIDNEANKVYVQIGKGRGYSYNFFSSSDIIWELRKTDLFLEVQA